MRLLRNFLRRLFFKPGQHSARSQKKECEQPSSFEAWISGYRQRLNHNCERDHPSK